MNLLLFITTVYIAPLYTQCPDDSPFCSTKSIQYFSCFLRSTLCVLKFHIKLLYDLFSHIPHVFHFEDSWRTVQDRGTSSVCTTMYRGTQTTKHLVILYRQGNHGSKFASSRMLVLNKLEGRDHSQAFFQQNYMNIRLTWDKSPVRIEPL